MLPAIRRNPTGVFMNAARRFGDVVYFKIGPRRGYLITSPATFDMFFRINARNYRKSPLYNKLRTVLGNGLLTSEGDFGCANAVSHSPHSTDSESQRWPVS